MRRAPATGQTVGPLLGMTAKKKSVPAKTRVLIVDDHPMMRDGLAALITAQPDLIVCGEAANAAEAMQSVEAQRPDLLLLDISLPGKSGLETIKDLLALHPRLSILVISMHDESFYAERVLRAGARGYIMKERATQDVLEGIRTVLGGDLYVSRKVAALGAVRAALLQRQRDFRQPPGLIADGTITGGMIPKVETCIYAIERGVEGVVILDGKLPHAVLIELLTDHGAGTLITR